MTKTPCPDRPNSPAGEVELHSLRERLALELARANALQDALDKEREGTALAVALEVRKAKAEALREAADSVHDNAASPYCLPCHRADADLLHTIATEYEREPERGVGR